MNSSHVKVKKNRVLPLKADLNDGDGTSMTDMDLQAKPVIQVIFNSAVAGDSIDVTDEALYAGQGTDGNEFEFTYDLHWQFNLKTKNYTAAGTYTVTMESGDDSEYKVDPTCTAHFIIE
jgi:hypothetical protein